MKEYSYESLKRAAEDAGVWIDVRDPNTMRGRNADNTNKKERVSRALSWYQKSESADADERLIFAFVAYNALYAQQSSGEQDENSVRERDVFWNKLQAGDASAVLAFAKTESANLKKILSLRYISNLFWKGAGDEREQHEKLRQEVERAKKNTTRQLDGGNLKPVRLAIVRISLLRNQIMHGMAAYQDSYNRRQVKLCADFLHSLVGRMIGAVICDQKQNWGAVPYPPQGYPNESRAAVEGLED